MFDWKACLKYPLRDWVIIELLDLLAEMVVFEPIGDKYCDLEAFIQAGQDNGLITRKEAMKIRFGIANNI